MTSFYIHILVEIMVHITDMFDPNILVTSFSFCTTLFVNTETPTLAVEAHFNYTVAL